MVNIYDADVSGGTGGASLLGSITFANVDFSGAMTLQNLISNDQISIDQ